MWENVYELRLLNWSVFYVWIEFMAQSHLLLCDVHLYWERNLHIWTMGIIFLAHLSVVHQLMYCKLRLRYIKMLSAINKPLIPLKNSKPLQIVRYSFLTILLHHIHLFLIYSLLGSRDVSTWWSSLSLDSTPLVCIFYRLRFASMCHLSEFIFVWCMTDICQRACGNFCA